MHFVEKLVYKDTVLFREGEEGDCAYVLKGGEVELSTVVRDKKRVVAILRPVSIFGEMAIFLPSHRRTLTAVTVKDSKIVEVSKAYFDAMAGQCPRILQLIIDVLVRRLKVSTGKASQIPDTFHALSLILDLTATHGLVDLDYEATSKTLCDFFAITPEEADPVFLSLSDLRLVDISRGGAPRRIKVLERGHFAVKAVRRLENSRKEEALFALKSCGGAAKNPNVLDMACVEDGLPAKDGEIIPLEPPQELPDE
jgi:CRP-like cAMP-binding protein